VARDAKDLTQPSMRPLVVCREDHPHYFFVSAAIVLRIGSDHSRQWQRCTLFPNLPWRITTVLLHRTHSSVSVSIYSIYYEHRYRATCDCLLRSSTLGPMNE
jgi:hypothetical protein